MLALLGACADAPPVIARLAVSAGAVDVSTGEHITPGVAGLGLLEDDVVSTGADGRASVEFEGGSAITMGPNTSLVIKRSGTAAAQFGVVLLRGEARASRQSGGLRFTIGTPFGIAELSGDRTDVSVSTEQGLVVHLGKIEVVGGGATKTIEAGNTLTLDGMIIPIGKDTIVLQPMTFVLLANPSQVQVKRAGSDTWKAPSKRDSVGAGDSVRTRKATGTRLQLGSHAGVALDPQTELRLTDAKGGGGKEEARYALASGNAVFELTRDEQAKEQVHQVEVAGQVVELEPGQSEANVEVNQSPTGRAQLTVRQGRAKLQDGAVIEAGQAVSLEPGKPASEPRPLADTHVNVRAGGSATIYYTSNVPPVEFSWSGEQPGPYDFEVAKDRDYKQLILQERLTKNGVVYDRLRAGRYYWRVKLGGQWKEGSIALERGRDQDCPNCKRVNVVDDTGENTVIYFQKTLPAITLRWSAVPGAVAHRVKVFADGAFDKAVIDQKVEHTTVDFPAGTFAENRYFWLVDALSAEGKEVAPGRMNSLTIAYDNAVADIDIKSPKSGLTVTTPTVQTAGEVELGSKLYVNGKQAELDKLGRFKVTLNIERGVNQLVYRTVDTKGVERLYVREVIRK